MTLDNSRMRQTTSRGDLLASLERQTRLLHASRSERVRRLPIKILWPYLLSQLGNVQHIDAYTFFNKAMRVVLPEAVSVRIWRYGIFEEDVSFYLIAVLRPGDTFIDIGGHFGYFSLLGGELVGAGGTVFTFEPMPGTRKILDHNINNNASPAQHHLICAAAGASAGRAIFKDFGLIGSAFATSEAGRSGAYELEGEVEVDVRTLDSVAEELAINSVRLIKIDAENAEIQVIKGAFKLIDRARPAIIIETGDELGDSSSASRRVVDQLVEQGYEPLEFRDWALHLHTPLPRYDYGNLLMVPREMMAELGSFRGEGSSQ